MKAAHNHHSYITCGFDVAKGHYQARTQDHTQCVFQSLGVPMNHHLLWWHLHPKSEAVLPDNSRQTSKGYSRGAKLNPRLATRIRIAGAVYVRWTPHPVIVTIRDNRGYIRVLLYSYYTTITGWGVLLRYMWRGLGA